MRRSNLGTLPTLMSGRSGLVISALEDKACSGLRVWQEDCMVSRRSSSPEGTGSRVRVPGLAVV